MFDLKIYEFRYSASGTTGFLPGRNMNHARERAKRLGLEVSNLQLSHGRTLLNPHIPTAPSLPDRAVFYRSLAQRFKDGGSSVTQALKTMIYASDSVAFRQHCLVVMEEVAKGQDFHLALQRAGFPVADVKSLEIGADTGELSDAIENLRQSTASQLSTRKQIKNSLAVPAFSIGLLWIMFFVAFSHFLPFIADIVSKISVSNNAASDVQAIFNFAIAVRDFLPFSAVVYFAGPFLAIYLLKISGFNITEIMIAVYPPLRKFFLLADQVVCLRIFMQHIRFKQGTAQAARAAAKAMVVPQMRRGLRLLCAALTRGDSVSFSIHRSGFPELFANDLVQSLGHGNATKGLQDQIAATEEDLQIAADVLKHVSNLVFLIIAMLIIIFLVAVAYGPILRTTISLSNY